MFPACHQLSFLKNRCFSLCVQLFIDAGPTGQSCPWSASHAALSWCPCVTQVGHGPPRTRHACKLTWINRADLFNEHTARPKYHPDAPALSREQRTLGSPADPSLSKCCRYLVLPAPRPCLIFNISTPQLQSIAPVFFA